ncbi:50S ribosomal protein L32 [candidate division WOR-3 bacterium RBG_13_43_14]|uniref:Large ribosomal subunit protein bL32 n=1 Tax=candidate division WOR-3 bacterium RBG_13_43_14 TaxID=1802590 RepID=A0A1F4U591_UNCW3|nr:MAG: 50S ribosomal protein L32 [candidate division WOR-3 bacterium RBG_13_43_14]
MPVPKRRHSHARKNKRRTHYKIKASNFVECPKCHEPRLPHRICPNCGFYKDKIVVKPKDEKEKE